MPTGAVLGTSTLNTDTITVVVLVVGTLLSIIGALSLIIFNDIRKKVNTNSKHVESLLYDWRFMQVRMTSAEDYLHQRDGYMAPRWVSERDDRY